MTLVEAFQRLHILICLLLVVFSHGLFANSYRVSPDPGEAGERFTFYLNLNESLASTLKVHLELGDGGGGWLDQGEMSSNSSRTRFTHSRVITQAGNRKYRFTFYQGSRFFHYPTSGYATYTVTSPNQAPRLISSSTSPTTVTRGQAMTFKTRWDDNENDYIVDVRVRYGKVGRSSHRTIYLNHESGYNFSYSQTMSESAGEYWYEVRAKDAKTANGSRINDTGWLSRKTFTIKEASSGKPDLDITSFSIDQSSITLGERIGARATVKNIGTAEAASTTLRYRLSTNSTISTSDDVIGTDSVRSLDPNESGNEFENLTIDSNVVSSLGTYYIGACVDAVTNESDTSRSSNCSSGVRLEISSPAPQISSFSPTTLTARDGNQYLTIYGSGFTSDTLVEWRNGSQGNTIPKERTDFYSESRIRILFNTTSSGYGTWYFTPKNGSVKGTQKTFTVLGAPAPTIASVSPTTVTLNQSTRFTIRGSNLPTTLAFYVAHCENMRNISRSTTSQQFECTPSHSVGVKQYVVRATSGGDLLKSAGIRVENAQGETSPRLTVSRTGDGYVYSRPSGINCNTDCSHNYSQGEQVKLYAVARQGWEFSRWKNYSACRSSVCSVTLDESLNMEAVFVEKPEPEVGTRLIDFSPKRISQGEYTDLTLAGVNLPATMVVNIHGTKGYCEQQSYSPTFIKVRCKPAVDGVRALQIADKPRGQRIKGSESWTISVAPPANTAPSVWVNKDYDKTVYVNETYSIVAKSYDSEQNLASIQVDWQANGEWNRLATVSDPKGEDVTFSYTPTSEGILKIRFRAVDTNGASAISNTYRVQVSPQLQPQEMIEKTGAVALEKERETNNNTCEGNPISPSNGAKIESRQLLTVNGVVPISFGLDYNSLIRGRSSVGIGWDFANAHAAKITEEEDQSVTVHWSENEAHVFTKNDDGSYTPQSEGCRLDTLQKLTSGQYRLERSGRDVYLFDEFNFLTRIENEKAQGLDLEYNDDSQLTRVTDPISGIYIAYQYNADGYLAQASTPAGRSVSLAYANNRLVSITHADGTVEGFTYTDLDQIENRSLNGVVQSTTSYDEFGRATEQDDTKTDNHKLQFVYNEQADTITTQVTDRNGYSKVLVFNQDYKLLQETDAVNTVKNFQYNDGGQPTRITDNKGGVTTISYNQYGDTTSIVTADKSVENRQYDSRRNLLTSTDAYGNTQTFTYDANNNRLTATNQLGQTTRYTYNSNNQRISETTPKGRTTQYAYTNGLLTSETNPKGEVRYFEYDQDGRIIAESDFRGNYTRYTLDNAGRKLSETDPLGNQQFWTYDEKGKVLSHQDAKGNRTEHQYNAQGDRTQTTRTVNGILAIWQYEYDGESRLISMTDPNGNTTQYVRDPLGRVTKTIDALGNETLHEFDNNNNLIRETDPLNNQQTFTYDEMNRVIEELDGLGNKTAYQYDALGRVHSITDALARFKEYTYDAASQLLSILHPGNLTATQSIDEDGDVASVTTPANDTRRLERDSTGMVIDEATADTISLRYEYNANDQVSHIINGRSQSTYFDYDTNSRLTEKRDEIGTVNYEYDANNNLVKTQQNNIAIERQYDEFNRVTQYSVNGSFASLINYQLDAVGNLTQLAYPKPDSTANRPVIDYTYDALDRMSTVSGFTNGYTAATYTYDSKGRLTKLVRGNNSELTLTYDAADRLTSSIDRDPNGNLIVQHLYTYDAIGRLASETITPQATPPASLIQPMDMIFGDDDRLVSQGSTVYNYDADGNILKAEGHDLIFDARNQLIRAGHLTYQYNAEGQRIAQRDTSTNTSTNYIVSPHHLGLVQVLRERKGNDRVRDFIYGAQGLLAQYHHDNQQHYYFHYDYRGSVVAISDEQGQVVARYGYMPFGQRYDVSGSFETPFGYNGRDGVVTDTNNLIYMRARYYSPSQQRFVSKDPIRGDIESIPSMNRYAYVGGDPINGVDPTGEAVWFIPLAYAVASAAWATYDAYNTIFDDCMTAYEKAKSLGTDVAIGVTAGAAGKVTYKLFKKTKKAKTLKNNKAAGKAAEAQAAVDLVAEGNIILGSQVSIRTSQGLRIVDHLVQDKNGILRAIEVKSGAAVRDPSQLLKDKTLATEGGVLVGKNAPPELRGTKIVVETQERRY